MTAADPRRGGALHRRGLLGRFFLCALLAGGGLGRAGTAAAQALGINWNRKAFAAGTVDEAARALGLATPLPAPGPQLRLVLSPEPWEDGAPVFATVDCDRADVRRVLLFVEKASSPLACVADFNEGAALPLRLPLKAPAEGGGVVAVAVLADGRVLAARGETAPVSASPDAGAAVSPAQPPEATRLRAQLGSGYFIVRAWLRHAMVAGRPAAGPADRPVEPWHLTEVLVQHDGRAALRLQCGPRMARNPVLQFNVRGAKLGERIQVSWLDNRGRRRSDEGAFGH